jgi:hypothetical protein
MRSTSRVQADFILTVQDSSLLSGREPLRVRIFVTDLAKMLCRFNLLQLLWPETPAA